MKGLLREILIYQILAVLIAFLSHPDAEFLRSLPGFLIITNCIAWSTRTLFCLASLHLDFLSWRRIWQVAFIPPAVAAGCAAGVLLAALLVELLMGRNLLQGELIMGIFRIALPYTLIVTILILGYQGMRDRLQSHALEQERLKSLRARAELAALQSKLNPHFLFNTLNSMLNQLHKEPARVETMILGLSDIYRAVLQLPECENIELSREFELAGQYLAIEQVRFGARLTYSIDLPATLRNRRVPPLLLQPLIENAVLHGIAPRPEGGRLDLSASHSHGTLRLVVQDDGVGFDPDDGTDGDDGRSTGSCRTAARAGSSGFGLRSARERLRILHGERGVVTVESPPAGGTRVTIEIPDDRSQLA
jgi:LytS/YehU family sensor histidine kinase